jgi:hypothetical protein
MVDKERAAYAFFWCKNILVIMVIPLHKYKDD